MDEEHDPRNARAGDPETSLLGTAGISRGHLAALVSFLRENDRPEGWTTGEIRDSSIGLAHPSIWRRVSDGIRDGLIAPVTGPAGQPVTRTDRLTRRAQRAHRAPGAPPSVTTTTMFSEPWHHS